MAGAAISVVPTLAGALAGAAGKVPADGVVGVASSGWLTTAGIAVAGACLPPRVNKAKLIRPMPSKTISNGHARFQLPAGNGAAGCATAGREMRGFVTVST